jgi:hypothetical protein
MYCLADTVVLPLITERNIKYPSGTKLTSALEVTKDCDVVTVDWKDFSASTGGLAARSFH